MRSTVVVAVLASILGMTAPLPAGPSFTAIDGEPLSAVAPDAVVLHAGWQMRESALAGDDGPGFSRAGFPAAGWYATSVPATPLGC